MMLHRTEGQVFVPGTYVASSFQEGEDKVDGRESTDEVETTFEPRDDPAADEFIPRAGGDGEVTGCATDDAADGATNVADITECQHETKRKMMMRGHPVRIYAKYVPVSLAS